MKNYTISVNYNPSRENEVTKTFKLLSKRGLTFDAEAWDLLDERQAIRVSIDKDSVTTTYSPITEEARFVSALDSLLDK